MANEPSISVEDLFHEAVALSREDRSRLLDERCAGDGELRVRVDALLRAHEATDAFLLSDENAATLPLDGAMVHDHLAGDRIGQYELRRLIGSGGMGSVYEAQQDEPRRLVALKILRPGMTIGQAQRRFRHEAQVLGELRHPGIAQIYEAGVAEIVAGAAVGERQPFFAMELIRGRAIDTYCRETHLDLRGRLELLAKVADAVQHAHDKGVIHRDLKPANILVDEFGQPKILDFGVARIVNADIQVTMQTEAGQIVGTLAYMSPEQVAGRPEEQDSRTDVYSLGVVLYELVAGKSPYNLRAQTLPEAARIIRNDEPSRLSSIDSRFRGDVETIVAKAMEKDKTRRYSSAAALAEDIRRYLADEPLVARPASTFYQIQKFAKRHKAVVGATAGIMAALVLGTAFATTFALREAQQRRIADAKTSEAQRLAYSASIAAAGAAHEQGDLQLAQQNLQRAPESLRGWEWRHLNWASNPAIATFDESAGQVAWAGASSNGSTIVALAEDGTLSVFDIASRRLRRRFSVPAQQHYNRSTVSPDGTLFALGTGDSPNFSVWDTATGKQLWRRPAGAAQGGDFSPDSATIALLSEGGESVNFCAAGTGQVQRTLPSGIVRGAGRTMVYFSPDEKHLIIGERLVDIESGSMLRLVAPGWVYLNHSWSEYVEVKAGVLRVQSLCDDAEIASRSYTLNQDLGDFDWLAHDKGLAIAYGNGKVDVMDRSLRTLWTSCLPRNLRDHQLLGDGRTFFTCTRSGLVQLWDLFTGGDFSTTNPPRFIAVSAAIDRDGRHLAIGDWGHVRLHDAITGEVTWCVPRPRAMHTSVAFSEDGRRIAAGDGTWSVNVIDAADGRELARSQRWQLPLALLWLPGGKQFLAGGAEAGLVLFDAKSPSTPVRSLAGHRSPINCLAIRPDGGLIASGSGDGVDYPDVRRQSTGANDHSIRLWNPTTWDCQRVITCDSAVSALKFSPDGQSLAAALYGGVIRTWDVSTGKQSAEWRGVGGCRAISYHSSGSRLVACAEDGTVFIWRIGESDLVAALPTRARSAFVASFTQPDDTLVLSSPFTMLARLETRPPAADMALRFNLSWAYGRITREGRRLNEDIEAALRRDDSLPPEVLNAALKSLHTTGDHVGYLVSDAIIKIRERRKGDVQDVETAARFAARARELLPDDESAAMIHAIALYHLKRFSEALAAAQRCIEIAVGHARSPPAAAHLVVGLCLDALGDKAKACTALQEGRTLAEKEPLDPEERELLDLVARLGP